MYDGVFQFLAALFLSGHFTQLDRNNMTAADGNTTVDVEGAESDGEAKLQVLKGESALSSLACSSHHV